MEPCDPVIIPVISGEAGRPAWSSSRRQRRSLQVEQEEQQEQEESQQRGDILGCAPDAVRRGRKTGMKVSPSK